MRKERDEFAREKKKMKKELGALDEVISLNTGQLCSGVLIQMKSIL